MAEKLYNLGQLIDMPAFILLSHVYQFRCAVIFLKKVNPETLFAQRNAGPDVRLHRTAIVVVNVTNFLVLRMMGMPTKDYIGLLFVGISCCVFSDAINRPCVVFAVVFQI